MMKQATLIEADKLPNAETAVEYTIPGQATSGKYSFGDDAHLAIMRCGSQPYACLLPWAERHNRTHWRAVVRLDFVRVVGA
jgi:hypothetical protein